MEPTNFTTISLKWRTPLTPSQTNQKTIDQTVSEVKLLSAICYKGLNISKSYMDLRD